MRRGCSSNGSDKAQEGSRAKFITFDYRNNLSCFISPPDPLAASKPHPRSHRPSHPPPPRSAPPALAPLRIPLTARERPCTSSPFNNSLLLLEWEVEEELRGEGKAEQGNGGRESPKSEEQDQAVKQIVNSCVEFITEETQPGSNPVTARPQQEPLPSGYAVGWGVPVPAMGVVDYFQCMVREPAVRNRRAISNEESRNYVVDVSRVELDGRTTIMVRNIPNKYTQEMLLELFERNHRKKFDFFYLPIDYNNNCNVGYAFLNFIHTKFIVDFYNDFHQRKWNKFNSVKVCQVCYARIQGTAQLEHHFQHSNVLQQKEKRYRPLIGLKSLADPAPTNELREEQ